MAIEITHVRFGSTRHTDDEIIRYKWREIGGTSTGENDKPSLVEWVDKPANAAYVGSGNNRVNVAVVRPPQGKPFLRTHADGKWTNNLVNLPTF